MDPLYRGGLGCDHRDRRDGNLVASSYRAVRFSTALPTQARVSSPSAGAAIYDGYLPNTAVADGLVAGCSSGAGYSVLAAAPSTSLQPLVDSQQVYGVHYAGQPVIYGQEPKSQASPDNTRLLAPTRSIMKSPYHADGGAAAGTRGGMVKKRPAVSVANKLVKKAKSILSVVNFPVGSSQRIAQLRKKYESNLYRPVDLKSWVKARASRALDGAHRTSYYDGGRYDTDDYSHQYGSRMAGVPDVSTNKWSYGNEQYLAAEHDLVSREKQLEEQISRAYEEYYRAKQQDNDDYLHAARSNGLAAYGMPVSSSYLANQTGAYDIGDGGCAVPPAYPDQSYSYHGYEHQDIGTSTSHRRTAPAQDKPSGHKGSPAGNHKRSPGRASAKPKPFSVGYLLQGNLLSKLSSDKPESQQRRNRRHNNTAKESSGKRSAKPSLDNKASYYYGNDESGITDEKCTRKESSEDYYRPDEDITDSDSDYRMRKLYVGDLLESVKKPDLEREFQAFGRVKDVWIAHNPPGFAFIEFYDRVGASNAVRSLDGKHVLGSKIRVEYAKSNGPRTGRGRKRRAASPQASRRRRSPSPHGRRSPTRRQRSPFPPPTPPLRSSPPPPPRRGVPPPPPPPIPPPLLEMEMRRRDRVAERRGRYNGYERARTPPPPSSGYRPRSRSPIARRRSPGAERGYPVPLPPTRRSYSRSPSPAGRNVSWERREAWYRDAERPRDYPPLPPPPPEVLRRSRSRSPIAPVAYSPRRSSPLRGHSPYQRGRSSPPPLPRGRTPPPHGRTPPPPRGRTPPPRGHTPLQRGRSPLPHGRSPPRARSPPPLRAMPPPSRPRSPPPRGHTPPPLRGHSPLPQRGPAPPLRGHTPQNGQSPIPRGHTPPRGRMPPPMHGRTPPPRGRTPPPPRGRSPPPHGHTPPSHGRTPPLTCGRTPPPLLRGRTPPPLHGRSPPAPSRGRMPLMVPRGSTPTQGSSLQMRGRTPPPRGRTPPPRGHTPPPPRGRTPPPPPRGHSPLPPVRNHSPPPLRRRTPPRGMSPMQHQRGRSPIGVSGADRMRMSPRPTAIRSNSPPRYR